MQRGSTGGILAPPRPKNTSTLVQTTDFTLGRGDEAPGEERRRLEKRSPDLSPLPTAPPVLLRARVGGTEGGILLGSKESLPVGSLSLGHQG